MNAPIPLRTEKRQVVLISLALFFTTFAVYWSSLSHEFVNWDDDVHVTANHFIVHSDLPGLLTTTVNKIYIPLTSLTFYIEYHLFRNNPFYYHFNNLLLHALNVVLIFLVVRTLDFSLFVSLIASLVFAIHPMHVESVAWITERKDVLYAFFYLLSVRYYLAYIKAEDRKLLGLSVFLGVLSLLAKPMALSLPLILILLDWIKGRPLSGKLIIEKSAYFAFFVPIAWMSYIHHARSLILQFPESVWFWINCFSFHIKKFFLVDYYAVVYKLYPRFDPVYALIFFGALILLIYGPRTVKFAILFYFLSVFFLLRFDSVNDFNVVADRFMYLPSFGFCLLIGIMIEKLYKKLSGGTLEKTSFYLLIFSLCFYLNVKTSIQIDVWQNSQKLWINQLKYQEHAATALVYKKLADAYLGTNELHKIYYADRLYGDALRIKPDYSQAIEGKRHTAKKLLLFNE